MSSLIPAIPKAFILASLNLFNLPHRPQGFDPRP
jgi:hypothetical protein